jgi:hypothetical protein
MIQDGSGQYDQRCFSEDSWGEQSEKRMIRLSFDD